MLRTIPVAVEKGVYKSAFSCHVPKSSLWVKTILSFSSMLFMQAKMFCPTVNLSDGAAILEVDIKSMGNCLYG